VSLAVDGGVREIGELRLTAPGSFTVAAGGGTLKLNTGIVATPGSPASYQIEAPVTMGAYNVTHLDAQSTLTFQAPVGGSVGFYLSGTGRMRLLASNPFTGPVTVDVGTLEVAGAKSGAGATTVFEDGTLTGAGTVAGAVTMHGTHAPGSSIGTLTHTGAIQYRATAKLLCQLGSNAAAAGSFDRVAAAAVTITAGARIEVELAAPGGTVDLRDLFWRSPRAWPVLASTALTGAFTLGTIGHDGLGNDPANYGTFSLAHSASGVTLHWTPHPAWESWRRVSFGVQWNDPAVAGELVDPEQDDLRNVVEYALNQSGDDPTRPPQIGRVGGRLTLIFTRNAAASDVTLTVRGADSVLGPWTDLAQSVGGAPLVPLVAGVGVAESGSAATPTVEVRDLFLVTDPAHPRRFLQLHVQR
jgi:autotransporter-associated beta strand protein